MGKKETPESESDTNSRDADQELVPPVSNSSDCGTLRVSVPERRRHRKSRGDTSPISADEAALRLFGPTVRLDVAPLDQESLLQLVAELPIEHRTVLLLHKKEGHSVEETARLLGLSTEQVIGHLASAIVYVRRRLQETQAN